MLVRRNDHIASKDCYMIFLLAVFIYLEQRQSKRKVAFKKNSFSCGNDRSHLEITSSEKKNPGWSENFGARPKASNEFEQYFQAVWNVRPFSLPHISEVLPILMHSSFSLAQRASYISWVPASPLGVLVYIFIIGSFFSFPFRLYVLTFEVSFFVSDWASVGTNTVVHSPQVSCSSISAGFPVLDTLTFGDFSVTATELALRRKQAN